MSDYQFFLRKGIHSAFWFYFPVVLFLLSMKCAETGFSPELFGI